MTASRRAWTSCTTAPLAANVLAAVGPQQAFASVSDHLPARQLSSSWPGTKIAACSNISWVQQLEVMLNAASRQLTISAFVGSQRFKRR